MDWTTLAVAGMSLVGALSGTFGGILVSSKLTTYRWAPDVHPDYWQEVWD